jgi:hypothetical protein
MKKLFFLLTISLLAFIPARAQTQPSGEAARPARQRLVGEVTSVDAAAKQLTVRADSGESATLTTTEQTTYLRMPPGETSLQKGQPAAFADVRVGDRVLAPGVSAAGGAARQIILMARAATNAAGGANGPGRDDGRRLNGRVVSADASKKLIVVQTRGREGVEAVTVDASSAARFLRYAPDSSRTADAQPGAFADVRAGDSLRAMGERSADGKSFKAEEVLTGAFARFVGTVTKVDAARNELTVTNEQAGQSVTLTLGARSSLRRATPEFEQAIAQRAERFGRREQRRAAGQGGGQAQGEGGAAREGRRDGERRREGGEQQGGGERRGEGGQRRGGGPGGGGGNNIQQMTESLPTVALADLKKGDAVVVTVTPSADATRATVVSLLTGSAEVLRSMQQFQRGGPEGQRGMSPGLPGDVIGGGQGPTREPPR